MYLPNNNAHRANTPAAPLATHLCNARNDIYSPASSDRFFSADALPAAAHLFHLNAFSPYSSINTAPAIA